MRTPVPCDTDRLIAEITQANARGGAVLDLVKDCTYLLTADLGGSGLPAIITPITLNGGENTIIERAAADQFRILVVNTGTAAVGGLFVQDGVSTVVGTRIAGNTASIVGGAAVIGNGELTLQQVKLVDNTANVVGGLFVQGVLLSAVAPSLRTASSRRTSPRPALLAESSTRASW